jgi:hypothetical protein
MTAAQKTAKDKFKKAIAYRQKTGVSLKEAFAHIYGRKVGAVKTTYGVYVYGSLVYETNDILIANAYAETYKKRGQNAIVKKIPKNKVSGSSDYYTRKKEGRVKARKTIKKAAPKKKVAKKVVRKVVKKKAAPKKKVAKKKLTRKDYDKRFQADKPGKRTSASGNTYYEYRENRVDYGKLLGIGFTLDKYNRLKK